MMFPDTSNAQQSAALRQAAERSPAASNTEYEYGYSTWSPMLPRREEPTGIRTPSRYASAQETLGQASR
jgi:hypothetical protein